MGSTPFRFYPRAERILPGDFLFEDWKLKGFPAWRRRLAG